MASTSRASGECNSFLKLSLGWEVLGKIFQLKWSAVIYRLKRQLWGEFNYQINSPFASWAEDEDGCTRTLADAAGAAAEAPLSSPAAGHPHPHAGWHGQGNISAANWGSLLFLLRSGDHHVALRCCEVYDKFLSGAPNCKSRLRLD